MVVYGENDKKVVVSLRQADILKALANDTELTAQGGGVPDLQHTTGAEYGKPYTSIPDFNPQTPMLTVATDIRPLCLSSIPSLVGLCSRPPLEPHGVSGSRSFWM